MVLREDATEPIALYVCPQCGAQADDPPSGCTYCESGGALVLRRFVPVSVMERAVPDEIKRAVAAIDTAVADGRLGDEMDESHALAEDNAKVFEALWPYWSTLPSCTAAEAIYTLRQEAAQAGEAAADALAVVGRAVRDERERIAAWLTTSEGAAVKLDRVDGGPDHDGLAMLAAAVREGAPCSKMADG